MAGFSTKLTIELSPLSSGEELELVDSFEAFSSFESSLVVSKTW